MVEEKGVEEIVHTVGVLTSCLPNVTAAIVGTGQHTVVATRTGGIIETIIDGENGLLVPPAEPMALAAAVQSLVADPELAEQIAARARLSVLDRFDRSVTADRVYEIYLELTARRSRAEQGLWQDHRS